MHTKIKTSLMSIGLIGIIISIIERIVDNLDDYWEGDGYYDGGSDLMIDYYTPQEEIQVIPSDPKLSKSPVSIPAPPTPSYQPSPTPVPTSLPTPTPITTSTPTPTPRNRTKEGYVWEWNDDVGDYIPVKELSDIEKYRLKYVKVKKKRGLTTQGPDEIEDYLDDIIIDIERELYGF